MIHTKKFFSLITVFSGIFCATLYGAALKESLFPSKKNSNLDKNGKSSLINSSSDSSQQEKEPAKVQLAFQEEFARQLANAGPKAEGWALFSESPMSHHGQRWIIKTPGEKADSFKYCLIEQGQKSCSHVDLSPSDFAKIEPVLSAGDKLDHIIPVVFDTVTFEYLHAFAGDPQTKRVVFMRSYNPFPKPYESLIEAFDIKPNK
jgi:hypothetical protein